MKVTEHRLSDQARMIMMNEWLTELEMNVIKQSSDDEDRQGEATEYECENVVNILQNNLYLSF